MRLVSVLLATLWLAPTWIQSEAIGQEVQRYRFAREQQSAADYVVFCFRGGPPTVEDSVLQQELFDLTRTHANVTFRPVDLDLDPELMNCSPAAQHAWFGRSESTRPRYAVFAPDGAELYADQNPPAVRRMFHSPARERLVASLDQNAGVFLFVAGEDPLANAECEKLLEEFVASTNSSLEPQNLPGTSVDQRTTTELPRIVPHVAWQRVDPHDLAEEWLVRTLRLQSDRSTSNSAPFICLVYGRARALPALVGTQISGSRLAQDWQSLLVSVAPGVQESLAGLDLPVQHDWDGTIATRVSARDAEPHRDPLVQKAGFESDVPPAVAQSSRERSAGSDEPSPMSTSLLTMCVAAGLIAIMWLMYVIIRPN